jgi:DnaK suppressor protein
MPSSPLSPAATARFAALIEREIAAGRSELEGSKDDIAPVAPDVAIGRLSRLDSMQMQAMAQELRRRTELRLVRLEEARRRLAAGTYGRCLRCGQPIALARLEVQPDAVACTRCAR